MLTGPRFVQPDSISEGFESFRALFHVVRAVAARRAKTRFEVSATTVETGACRPQSSGLRPCVREVAAGRAMERLEVSAVPVAIGVPHRTVVGPTHIPPPPFPPQIPGIQHLCGADLNANVGRRAVCPRSVVPFRPHRQLARRAGRWVRTVGHATSVKHHFGANSWYHGVPGLVCFDTAGRRRVAGGRADCGRRAGGPDSSSTLSSTLVSDFGGAGLGRVPGGILD